MTKEVGTLKELNVKPGDVVECVSIKLGVVGLGEILTINKDGNAENERIRVFTPEFDVNYMRTYRLIFRAPDTPTSSTTMAAPTT